MRGLWCLWLLVWGSAALAAPTLVPVYYYHDKPPYVIDRDKKQGLYFDLINHLNQQGAELHFYLRYMPRTRLERDLEKATLDGPVLGVNPLWFKDADRSHYLWSTALFVDRDIVVSPLSAPFEYGEEPLLGHSVCQVRGYFYDGITQAAAVGELVVLPVAREPAIFTLLDQLRCDFGLISQSMYDYLRAHDQISASYYVAKRPQAVFERYFLLLPAQAALHEQLQRRLTHWPIKNFSIQ